MKEHKLIGIKCDGNASPTIIGNEITRHGLYGIDLEKLLLSIIENNIITQNGY